MNGPKLTFTDPHNVQEVFAGGPINLTIRGSVAVLTLTNPRPDAQMLLTGAEQNELHCVVVARIVLPTDALPQIQKLIADTLSGHQTAQTAVRH